MHSQRLWIVLFVWCVMMTQIVGRWHLPLLSTQQHTRQHDGATFGAKLQRGRSMVDDSSCPTMGIVSMVKVRVVEGHTGVITPSTPSRSFKLDTDRTTAWTYLNGLSTISALESPSFSCTLGAGVVTLYAHRHLHTHPSSPGTTTTAKSHFPFC